MTSVGDLLVEYKEVPSPQSTAPVLTLTEKNGFIRQADRFHKRLATEDTSKYKVVRRNDIAFNPYLLWAGAVAQNTIVDEGIISPLYPTFKVREGHDPRYVARLLLAPQMIAAYDTIAFGSVPRRRRSSVENFLNLAVPDPPNLTEQQRISGIIDCVDAILRNCRLRIQGLDALARAEFAALVRLHPGTVPLGEVAEFYGGTTLPAGEIFRGQAGGYFLMKVSDMNAPGNEEQITSCTLWSPNPGPRASTCPPGSVVLPKRGGAIGTNKKRITTRSTVLDPNLMGVRPSSSAISPSFMLQWFKQFDLLSITSGSTVPQLNKKDLEPLNFPDIGEGKQKSFVSRMGLIDGQAKLARESLRHVEGLAESLRSQAFAGKL